MKLGAKPSTPRIFWLELWLMLTSMGGSAQPTESWEPIVGICKHPYIAIFMCSVFQDMARQLRYYLNPCNETMIKDYNGFLLCEIL